MTYLLFYEHFNTLSRKDFSLVLCARVVKNKLLLVSSFTVQFLF